MATKTIERREVMDARWKAVITYSGMSGRIDVEYALEELEELQDIVEHGPDWNSIVDIRLTLARRLYAANVEDTP